jgi:hypothetical protein
MGAQGNEEGAESTFVFDAGALIGVERGSEMMSVLLAEAEAFGDDIVIPASALAQVWRGGAKAARLAKLIDGFEIDALDETRAREVGQRLGARGGRDVVDAHVVCCAAGLDAAIVTSDLEDTEALISPDEKIELIRV